MPRPRRIRITTVVLLILLGLVAGHALLGGHARERVLAAGRIFLPSHHMHDRAGLLTIWERARAEQGLGLIQDESDIDIRYLLVNDLHGASIDAFAAAVADSMRIGIHGSEARGLLLVYDVRGKQVRIEVGYGLEPYFPDAFIGFLITDHVRDFFAAEDPETGLILTARMLLSRVREAALGGDYDPRPVETLRVYSHATGGAGASGAAPFGTGGAFLTARLSRRLREYFGPQPTPVAAYERYLEWLAAGATDPEVSLFTPETREFLSNLPMSPGYIAFWYMLYAHKGYGVEQRGDLAMVYLTSSPLASPIFFRNTPAGWQMDVIGELNNTAEYAGGQYTWAFVHSGDDYDDAFLGDAVQVGEDNAERWPDGDNRPLPARRRT